MYLRSRRVALIAVSAMLVVHLVFFVPTLYAREQGFFERTVDAVSTGVFCSIKRIFGFSCAPNEHTEDRTTSNTTVPGRSESEDEGSAADSGMKEEDTTPPESSEGDDEPGKEPEPDPQPVQNVYYTGPRTIVNPVTERVLTISGVSRELLDQELDEVYRILYANNENVYDTIDIPDGVDSFSDIGGVLSVAQGGTGLNSFTAGDLLYAGGASDITKLSIGANGEVLTVVGGVPTWAAPSGGGGFSGGELIASHITATSTTATSTFAGNISVATDKSYRIGGAPVLGLDGAALFVGSGNTATGTQAVAVGYQNNARDFSSIAFGRNNNANQNGSAIGDANVINVDGGLAFGRSNTVNGADGSAFGLNTDADGSSSVAFGRFVTAAGTRSTALGNASDADGTGSVAAGYGVSTSANYASAFGVWSSASANSASSFGYSNTASGAYSSAFGWSNTAQGDGSLAFGAGIFGPNTASANYSAVIGMTNTASANYAFAVGINNTASANYAFVFGNEINNNIANSAMIGPSDTAKLTILSTGEAMANFFNATSSNATSTFAGNISVATDKHFAINGSPFAGIDTVTNPVNPGVFFGTGNTATGTRSTVIGINNNAGGDRSFVGGYNNTLSFLGNDIGSVLVGDSNEVYAEQVVAIGYNNEVFEDTAVAIGYRNDVEDRYGIAIGYLNEATGFRSIALGNSSLATKRHSASLGSYNTVNMQHSVASGYGNTVHDSSAAYQPSVAMGAWNDVGNFTTGNVYASALGVNNTVLGDFGSAFGYDNTASGYQSVSFGYKNTASATGTSAFGSNITNNIESSTMIGPADNSKLTILSEAGKEGFVGIGTTTPTAQLSTTGSVRFSNFGAGTLETDADGNVTIASDERLKDIEGNFTRSIAALQGINPISFRWNEESGFETQTIYTGFSAQNIEEFIPEAVGEGPDGLLTLSDRPILATVVNAVKDIWKRLTSLERRVDVLEAGDTTSTTQVQNEFCVENVCVDEGGFRELLEAYDIEYTEYVDDNDDQTGADDTDNVDVDTDMDDSDDGSAQAHAEAGAVDSDSTNNNEEEVVELDDEEDEETNDEHEISEEIEEENEDEEGTTEDAAETEQSKKQEEGDGANESIPDPEESANEETSEIE